MRAPLLLIAAVLSCSCSTPAEIDLAPKVEGNDVQLRLRLSGVGPAWRSQLEITSNALAGITPHGLDRPIRITLAAIPRPPAPDGEIVIKFGVSSLGYVTSPRLIRSVGNTQYHSSLDIGNTAILALAQWRFSPPIKNGAAVSYCCVTLTID
jgi:hypothetical protein